MRSKTQVCRLYFTFSATTNLYSSVSFNPYHKTTLASADYEGCVSVWDVNTCSKKSSHHEHNKRVWSVVYNPTEPMLYASGSDDSTGMWATMYVSK